VLAGFNEDIRVEGQTYHIQSEDRGDENPILETLIYTGGQILDQVKTSYAELVESGEATTEKVAELLAEQHKDVLRRVRHGEFAPEGRRTLSDFLGEDQPMQQLVAAVLGDGADVAMLELDWQPATAKHGVIGRLRVRDASSGDPVPGALVTVHAVGQRISPIKLAEGTTDEFGEVLVASPTPAAEVSALLFRAESGPGGGRARVPYTAAPPVPVEAASTGT